MLISHKILDALLGRDARYAIPPIPGEAALRPRTAALLASAEKFDFGSLPFERDPTRVGSWTIPKLSDDERDFWHQGLLPLPAPLCWFEFTLGGSRSGLLVAEHGTKWILQRIDVTLDRHILHDALHLVADRADPGLRVAFHGNPEGAEWLKKQTIPGLDLRTHAENMYLAIYMVLMINSRTTEVRRESAPDRLNKKRAAAGKTPLVAHRVVTIVPTRFHDHAEAEARGTHRSPRLHWRRSHLRHYEEHTPSSVWAPAATHDGRVGWWVVVIPRMLVSRAELGEVSHEYRVRGEVRYKENSDEHSAV